jgi:hypothetical protein
MVKQVGAMAIMALGIHYAVALDMATKMGLFMEAIFSVEALYAVHTV